MTSISGRNSLKKILPRYEGTCTLMRFFPVIALYNAHSEQQLRAVTRTKYVSFNSPAIFFNPLSYRNVFGIKIFRKNSIKSEFICITYETPTKIGRAEIRLFLTVSSNEL